MARFEVEGGTLRIEGDLKAPAAKELRRLCAGLFDGSEGTMHLDLMQVKAIDSSCISVLASLWVRATGEGRRLELVVSPGVRRILEYSGFDKVFSL